MVKTIILLLANLFFSVANANLLFKTMYQRKGSQLCLTTAYFVRFKLQ